MQEIISKLAQRLTCSFYFISVTFIIFPLILTYIDKRQFDLIYIANIILLIMQLLSITYTFFFHKDKPDQKLLKINCLLWALNLFLPFFVYINSNNCDFQEICNFMNGIRMFTAFLFILAKAFSG